MDETTPRIDAKRAALLVMDYQPAILGRLPDGGEELLARATEAISLARAQGICVGYVHVAFGDADFERVPETNKSFAPIAAGKPAFLHENAPESSVDTRIAPEAGDIVVRKVRVGAFSTTDLDQRLRAEGIDTLILAGISTSGVVLSTVRDAADKDYRLFVLSDACADPESDVHRLLIEKVFPRQAYVVTVADLPGLLTAETK